MKSFIGAATLFAAAASAHSWLGCTDYDNSQVLEWMKGNATNGVTVDPLMPAFASFCKGWPRNKNNPGDWIDESTNYVWNLAANKFNGDNNACRENQREPIYKDNAPMWKGKAGSTIRLMFGGNGHARGASVGGDPGKVSVYWAGKPETEITSTKEFTDENRISQSGFSEESFAFPEGVTKPDEGLVDKGNWQSVKLPEIMEPGRHMLVWVWSYEGADQWSTCFDVQIE